MDENCLTVKTFQSFIVYVVTLVCTSLFCSNKSTLRSSWIHSDFSSSISPTFNRKHFQSVLKFHWILEPIGCLHIRGDVRYERGGVTMKARSDSSELLWKNTEEKEATTTCKQLLRLKRLAWTLDNWPFFLIKRRPKDSTEGMTFFGEFCYTLQHVSARRVGVVHN